MELLNCIADGCTNKALTQFHCLYHAIKTVKESNFSEEKENKLVDELIKAEEANQKRTQ